MNSSEQFETPDYDETAHSTLGLGSADGHVKSDAVKQKNEHSSIVNFDIANRMNCTAIDQWEHEHKKHVAFHVAGHAAAMYLNNKEWNLPPLYFQIKYKDSAHEKTHDFIKHHVMPEDRIPYVEGGLLIQSLSSSIFDVAHKHMDSTVHLLPDYMAAFEADIINLLAGPLAEARYVHDCDSEPFTRHLIDLEALRHYNGDCDLELVHDYLQKLFLSREQQDKKLLESFNVAFNFVKNCCQWHVINQLADYIFDHHSNVITYEEIVSVLEAKVPVPHKIAI
ncbi:MAG: hypothetical protein ACU83N_14765 [Gammaproteobacteria bacterium]